MVAPLVGVSTAMVGGIRVLRGAVSNCICQGEYMALPDTASMAVLVTRVVIHVEPGQPPALGVKVIVSFAAITDDQVNEPPTAGVVPKADCTLFVFMDLLN